MLTPMEAAYIFAYLLVFLIYGISSWVVLIKKGITKDSAPWVTLLAIFELVCAGMPLVTGIICATFQ